MEIDQSPELTIVIPSKNEENYIRKTLDSLASQDYRCIASTPVYVADANSTDRTQEIANEYTGHLSIKVIKGGLPSVGRNRGAALARSKYVLFIDADVELPDPLFLRKAVELANEKELWCVGVRVRLLDGILIDHILFGLSNLAQSLSRLTKPYATGMFLLFNREVFNRLGGFNEKVNYGEDVFLTQRVPRKRFGIASGYAKTSNRRFVAKGRGHILWLALKTVWNQVIGREEFFYRDHKYFD